MMVGDVQARHRLFRPAAYRATSRASDKVYWASTMSNCDGSSMMCEVTSQPSSGAVKVWMGNRGDL
jgi:hypothetical protein